jgi:hypothetical protein
MSRLAWICPFLLDVPIRLAPAGLATVVLRKNSMDDLESLIWMFYLCSLHLGVSLVGTAA